MSEKRPRGWNLRKGAKDAPNVDTLRERGSKGGKVTGKTSGFAHKEILEKAVANSVATRKNQSSKKATPSTTSKKA